MRSSTKAMQSSQSKLDSKKGERASLSNVPEDEDVDDALRRMVHLSRRMVHTARRGIHRSRLPGHPLGCGCEPVPRCLNAV
jgi:hypothetical protein